MFKLNGSNTYYIVLPVVQNTCSDQDLLCCRACLSTDGGLYNIHEYKLADAFSAIAGTSIIRDQLPQYLCSHCRTLLMKFASFRNMCTRTQQQLLLGLQTGQLNTNYIHSIYQPSHRFFNLTITEVETIDCILEDETDPENYIKIMETLTQDINLETPIAEDIKDEPNIDIIDINNILNNTDEMIEFDTEIDEESNHIGNNIVPIKDRTGTKSKIESVNGHVIEMDGGIINENEDKSCQSVSQGNELNVGFGDDHIENMNDASSIQNKKNPVKKRKRNVSSVQNPNNTVKKLNGNKKEKKKTECKLKEKIASRKLVRGRKRIKKENEKMRRNEIFESNYSVKIVFLSKVPINQVSLYLKTDFKCKECYKGFWLKDSYENHMHRHSAGGGPYECDLCHIRFASNRNRSAHQEMHRTKILCTLCDFVSRKKSQAMLHHGVHAGRVYECQHCGKSFKKRSTHFSHVRLAHPGLNVACEECGEVFVSRKGLGMHKGKIHAKKMNCEICSAKFVSSAALDRHTDTAGEHKDLRPCEQCGENCASEDALQKHVEDTHSKESIRCDVCSISFPNTEAYTTHVSRSHLQERMVIKQSRQYREWKKQKTLMKKTELVCEQSPGVKKTEVMCEQCGDKFPFPSQLKLHQQKYHQALKPYLCNECAKGFSSKAGLEDHIRSHTGEKPYNCKHCSLAFSMRGNLNRHHNTVHLGLRGCFACDICGSTVSTKSSLRLHIETKHGGRDWPRSRKRQQAQKLKEKLTINKDRK